LKGLVLIRKVEKNIWFKNFKRVREGIWFRVEKEEGTEKIEGWNGNQEKERRGRGRDHTRAHMPSINQDAHFLFNDEFFEYNDAYLYS
jgi:hypothetical protein